MGTLQCVKQGSGASKPLVYDIGMNEGQNIPYYLAKGCRVVAVEAAPPLVDDVRRRFATDIANGDLTLLNVGISSNEGALPFYFNRPSDQTTSPGATARPVETRHM